jgi:enoyl-CoA hydratase
MSVDIATRGSVRIVTINRPERRNALDPETFLGLGRAFVEAEHDDRVRAVVLTGAGEHAFCSGMDLKAFVAEKRDDEARVASGPGTDVFVERVYPKPIVAAVNGAAVAGGLGIMLGCDIVVAADHAVFGLPEVKRGLVGVGATSRATLRLPPAAVLELALTGAPMDATRALHHGLVNRVVSSEEVLPTAIALAEEIAANAPLAVALAKEIVYDAGRLLHVDIAEWRERAAPIFASNDAREGATAFAEKRTPRFTGS